MPKHATTDLNDPCCAIDAMNRRAERLCSSQQIPAVRRTQFCDLRCQNVANDNVRLNPPDLVALIAVTGACGIANEAKQSTQDAADKSPTLMAAGTRPNSRQPKTALSNGVPRARAVRKPRIRFAVCWLFAPYGAQSTIRGLRNRVARRSERTQSREGMQIIPNTVDCFQNAMKVHTAHRKVQ